MEQLHEPSQGQHYPDILRQALQNDPVAVTMCMLVDVEQDSQSTTGDVVQFCTVDDHMAVCTFIDWFEATGGLGARGIVEVADEGKHEPCYRLVLVAGLFAKCDFKHTIYILTV